MSIISMQHLCRHFKVLNRHEGLSGAFRDLFSRDYRTIKAVNDISAEIHEGEFIGFLGPNGAGKSTTIKMMTGVLEPTSGEILVNGNIPYKNRKRNALSIGVVFGQRSQLWWDLPVIESFKLLKEIYRIDKKSYEENLDIFNQLVDLKALYLMQVRTLSLGQRMLCDIVASFLHNPKVIFLDEPTIGLDVSIKSKIRQVLKDLNQVKKATIILTTHDIGDIEALCERIIIIDKGSVIFDGDIGKITGMFGSYRTLKIEPHQRSPIGTDNISRLINSSFNTKHPILVESQDDGWISLTIDQDEVQLLEVLSCITGEFQAKDIKVEEIRTEDVIKKIYEGELYEKVPYNS